MRDGSLPRVLVTGATGFVGRSLVPLLERQGYRVRRAARGLPASAATQDEWVACGEIGPNTDWQVAVAGCSGVIHLAGRAHVLREQVADPLAEFRRVNVEGTLRLARMAVAAGVRRFVFVSSIGVNGRVSDRPFVESDDPRPHDLYAVSKFEAEQGLGALAQETGLEVVIVRPPLVYGPGCPGNLARLLGLLRRGIPLPLGSVDNRRSMIGVDNLADMLALCLSHPAAAGQLFLVSDGEDVSTPRILRGLAAGLGVPLRIIFMPPRILELLAGLVGRGADIERLCSSLQVDSSKAQRVLGWRPRVAVDEGLRRTGAVV